MEFRTIVPIVKTKYPIDYHSKIVSFGSCFAENMSAQFNYYKFTSLCNPFGIIFNAVSLETILQRIVNQKYFTSNDIFENNGLWHCYEIHSGLSQSNKTAFLLSLNEILESTYRELLDATHLIVTFGTSWVYELKNSQQVVANCHKMPQNEFSKILLSQQQNSRAITNLIAHVQKINTDIKFIFTISPVRHLKDGFLENNVSKSLLLTALFNIIDKETVTYFPSYEIMMDDLRDYRFYAKDFLHPSEIATDYIWEKFKESQIAVTSFTVMEEVKNIQKMISHRILNKESEAFKKFNDSLQKKISLVEEKNPTIRF